MWAPPGHFDVEVLNAKETNAKNTTKKCGDRTENRTLTRQNLRHTKNYNDQLRYTTDRHLSTLIKILNEGQVGTITN